ncbi:unnamed protein product [Caenorhabditis nigoni]
MNEAVIKDEVIEEEHDLTFINGEYVEVKQEEIEEKPEHLLEKDIKTDTIDFFENNNSDEFPEDIQAKPKESDSKIEIWRGVSLLKCTICQKRMPRSLLKWIRLEEDKTVLSQFFKLEGYLETRTPFVCYTHIQMIINDNDGKLKLKNIPFKKLLRSFIRRNKSLMKDKESRRRICEVCHMSRGRSEVCETFSYRIRMAVMIGRILRGTHSVEQAKSFSTDNKRFTCYSHFKESIDEIFKHLGVKSIQELSKCSTMGDLMNIGKSIDPNFTVEQFVLAFKELFLKNQKFESNL